MEIGPLRNQNGYCLVKIVSPTDNEIYAVPANQFSPSPGTTLVRY